MVMLHGLPVDDSHTPAATAVTALGELYRAGDAPSKLADYGFTAENIPEAAGRVLKAVLASNPVTVTEENITDLLTEALTGAAPTTAPRAPRGPPPRHQEGSP